MEVATEVFIPESSTGWEVRANSEWLFVKKEHISFNVPIHGLMHCIVSCGSGYLFRLVTKENKFLEFTVKKSKDAQALFLFLDNFCSGFRNIVSTYTPRSWQVSKIHFRLDRNELASDIPRLFQKGMKPYHRIPVQTIVSVTQHHTKDADELSDAYYLRVYTNNGKYHDVECSNVMHSFELACMIKDNAPHVRYGVDAFTGFSGVITGK